MYHRSTVANSHDDLVGRVVGRIRITGVLGGGGMGRVFEGVDEALQRRVAVKAIRGEHRLHREAKARFLREARILSQVNHRNVCVVHDLIETDDSDYLVLELVPGRSLRRAMTDGLSEREKLGIARQLLEVLVAVHGAGVIHRDLKPENIMLRPDGEITVLDFGLARSVEDDIAMFSEAPMLDLADLENRPEPGETLRVPGCALSIHVRTNLGSVVGTAGYMSPEQARAEPSTAASDIYSAGLILQELFTGSPPIGRELPATVLVDKAAHGESLPVTGLPPDLTALIERMKSALPAMRPSSVDALAELKRVIERPARRRRRAVVAAVWVVLAMLAGGMTVQWLRASREADRANREAVAAEEVSDFLVSLFEESNPEQARGASLSAEEILHRGAERIAHELEEQPLTRSRLLATIGSVYRKMGLYDQAISILGEALDLRTRELGETSAEVASTLSTLGDYERRSGDFEAAEAHLLRAIELYDRLPEADPIDRAGALLNLGNLLSNDGRLDEAEARLQNAYDIYAQNLGPDHLFSARCEANLAILIARQGRVEEAEPIFRRVLGIQERELGPDHPSVGEATTNLAIALKILGRYDEAEALYLRNLEMQERVLGDAHPDLCKVLGNLANLYTQMGRLDEAEPFYLRSLEISRASLGPEHPEVALDLDNLGALYIEMGRLEDAERLCLEAKEIREKVLDPAHPHLATTLLNLAAIHRAEGRAREAEEMYRRGLAICVQAFAPGHPKRLSAARELADFLREQGRETEATALEAREVGEPL